MTTTPGPDWLQRMQTSFGDGLRTPLTRAKGEMRCDKPHLDRELLTRLGPQRNAGSAERFSVYNEQYWYRLFTVLHGIYPLVTRLLGHWTFNGVAQSFLREHPPAGYDIDTVGDGFTGYLERNCFELKGEPEALLQSARIDGSWHAVLRAPSAEPWVVSASDWPRLAAQRLQWSGRAVCVVQDWPLLELRKGLSADKGESVVPLPGRLGASEHWVILRTRHGIGNFRLHPSEARLFALLNDHCLAEALAILEQELEAPARAQLPNQVRAWLGRAVRLRFWTGTVAPDDAQK